MTSYLRENEAENLQNGYIHLVQIPDCGMGYLENRLRSVMARGLFFIFHALSFELNLFLDRSFP